ncbi:hypothetical protein SeLEV6574_g05259 [Synchytrium endobioticum]|uniref:Uncharacterized protein n=1 Tax=Synchytrium endobioticum TaxID=286115 RepID=A0A507CW19_9FUNG|nr:hypothetical protein SeLEV6574_g05259 [Synchytrium endobioticum]
MGKLIPLPIMEKKWQGITLDFVVKLPQSKLPGVAEPYDSILVSDRNFDVAKGVFFNFDEGNVLDPLDRSKGLEKRDKSETLISKARATLVANRGSRGTTPMKCPVPPILKVSPKVVEFDHDKYEEVNKVSEEKAVKPNSKAKAKRAPSGRSSRRKIVEKDDSDEETSKKNFSDATSAIASLSQRAIAERATEMLIDGICSSNQDTHLLLQLTHGGKGGANYWQNLLRMIVNGTIGARVGSEHRPILDKVVQALWGANLLRNLSWPDTDIKTLMLSVLIHKVAADIDTVFSNQIVGMLPLLKERVVEVVGEEGKQAIEEIEAWVDESLEDDPSSPPPPVQVLYKINRLLPGPYRWSIVPHTSFGDGYVTMSEECLFDLLFDIPRYRDWLEADKPEVICIAERECTKSDQETWAVFLERFVRSYDIARAYYSTKKYKRKRWDADKAKRGELDRVLEGIVNMVGESMGHKLPGGGRRL